MAPNSDANITFVKGKERAVDHITVGEPLNPGDVRLRRAAQRALREVQRLAAGVDIVRHVLSGADVSKAADDGGDTIFPAVRTRCVSEHR